MNLLFFRIQRSTDAYCICVDENVIVSYDVYCNVAGDTFASALPTVDQESDDDDDTVYSEEELLKRLSHGQQRMEQVRQIMIGLYVLGQQLVNSQCFGMPN